MGEEKSIKTRQEERGDGEGQGLLHQRLLKLEIEKSINKTYRRRGVRSKIIKTRREERGDGERQWCLHQRLLKLEVDKIIKTRQEERGEEKSIQSIGKCVARTSMQNLLKLKNSGIFMVWGKSAWREKALKKTCGNKDMRLPGAEKL